MIIKCNITGLASTRLKLTSKLFTQLHVERKTDEFGRRVSTSWTTGNTEVTLERYHSNKNSKDVDGVIYVGRSFQQYMDKFDADLGLRLATVRAFNKFFTLNGKTAAKPRSLPKLPLTSSWQTRTRRVLLLAVPLHLPRR